MTARPRRGFEHAEFETRLSRAQHLMAGAELDGLLVTSEQHVRYVTGFDSQFWASPTRPWTACTGRRRRRRPRTPRETAGARAGFVAAAFALA